MLESHTANKRAVCQEGNMHGREGEESMHNVRSLSSNAEEARNMAGPQSEVVGIQGSQLMVERSDVVDQAQILD